MNRHPSKYVFLIAMLLLELNSFGQSYTVDTVPNTKLQNNSFVSNPDGLLTEGIEIQINQLLIGLEQQTTAQVSVVMLNSIGDAEITDFAQSLFETWKIGQADKDNGLLILYVQDQRTIRFHTGFGLEGVLPDAVCKRIQTQKMVPLFKEGNIDGGMLAGTEEVVRIISDPTYANEISESIKSTGATKSDFAWMMGIGWVIIGLITFFTKRKSGFTDSLSFNKNAPNSKMSSGQWFLLWILLPLVLLITLSLANSTLVFIGGLYAFFNVTAVAKYARLNSSADSFMKKGEYQTVYNFYKENEGVLDFAFLFPIPFAFLSKHFNNKMNLIRIQPRTCKNCGGQCVKLSEMQEDEYLSKESQFEENIKSVDYDVWKCTNCKEVQFETYITDKTTYSNCPKCGTRAYYISGSSTKKAATTRSTGIMIYEYVCKFCNHKSKQQSVIPKIVVSSDSSSSSDSGYSSSDSGGSYGGGDSGGGGSSSSW
jgi:uncharacterized protein